MLNTSQLFYSLKTCVPFKQTEWSLRGYLTSKPHSADSKQTDWSPRAVEALKLHSVCLE